MQAPALVLGTGLTALGVVRALGRRGVPVRCQANDPELVGDSRWYRPAPPRAPDEPLAAYLARTDSRNTVLVPCSDSAVREVAGLSGGGESWRASVPPLEAVQQLTDKARFAALLGQTGVPHPRTNVDAGESDVVALFTGAPAGVFLKPRDSQRFFARFGVKAMWARTGDEAARRLGELSDEGHRMILQEYVPGPASNHYFVDGFVDRHGSLCAAFVRRRLRMHPPDFGNSTYMVSVAPEEARESVDSIKRLLDQVRYRGIFSAEFKRDERDGAFKILEVNARPWWYVEFAARCGVDVVAMCYRDALELPVETISTYVVGRALAYPYYDYSACRELRRRGELSWARWAGSWLGAVYPVWAWDDPKPAVWAAARRAGGFIQRRVRRARV